MPTILHGVVLIAALMLSGGAAVAESDVQSGNYVMPGCRASLENKVNSDAYRAGLCSGTILTLLNLSERLGICTPDTVTVAQLRMVVVKYINERPARMHENFMKLAIEALRTAWPCKK